MEKKKEKKKYVSETAAEWLMLPDKWNLTHHSVFILLLWWEKKSWKKISCSPPPPPSPALLLLLSWHLYTGKQSKPQRRLHVHLGAGGFFCFNSQLGKASEVTLEKCMHQRKKLWKGEGGSVGVLVCFMFGGFFFPHNVFPNFHWNKFASYY